MSDEVQVGDRVVLVNEGSRERSRKYPHRMTGTVVEKETGKFYLKRDDGVSGAREGQWVVKKITYGSLWKELGQVHWRIQRGTERLFREATP